MNEIYNDGQTVIHDDRKKVNIYYYLKEGEIIQEGDECEVSNKWNDPPKWVHADHTVGTPAPDPAYIAHRKYRRLIHA